MLVFSAESYDTCTVLEIVNDDIIEDEETFLITLTAVTVDPYVALPDCPTHHTCRSGILISLNC